MPDWAGAARLADTPDRRSAWASTPVPNLRERRVRTRPQPGAPRLNDTPRGGRPRQSSGSGRIAIAAVKASPSQAHRRTAAALRRFSGQRALAGASPALAPEMPSCSDSPQFHTARVIGLWPLVPQMPCPDHSTQPVDQSPCPSCWPTVGVECGRCPTEPRGVDCERLSVPRRPESADSQKGSSSWMLRPVDFAEKVDAGAVQFFLDRTPCR